MKYSIYRGIKPTKRSGGLDGFQNKQKQYHRSASTIRKKGLVTLPAEKATHLQTTARKLRPGISLPSFQVNIKLGGTAPFIYRLSNLHVMYFPHTSTSLSTLKANTGLTEQNYLPIIAAHKSRPIFLYLRMLEFMCFMKQCNSIVLYILSVISEL